MAFQINIAGADTLSLPKLITQVQIERALYDHTRAQITLRWQEQDRYGDFHGYIENISAHRETSSTSLVLNCIAFSKRTDLVPVYRTFQATTLLDIAQHIAGRQPLIQVAQSGDMTMPIDLSVQHSETDWAYLVRMLHAWGVPLATEDKTGKVILGARGAEAKQDFPDVTYGWTQVDFSGGLHALPVLASGGSSGPTAITQSQLAAFQKQLSRRAADYFAIPAHPDIKGTHSKTVSQVDTSSYHLKLEGAVLAFSPGEVVSFEGQQHLINRVHIAGYPQQATATQEFWLQPLTLPLPAERKTPQWPSRAVWAHVTANEHDPQQQGRIQVEFEWEHMDPQASGERAWLHTLTPYGGGSGGTGIGGKQSGQYSGFYSLPEVGERVLVEFLGDWDSEAVVIGVVRQHPQGTTYNPHQTKRWSTPSGNEMLMHTLAGKDVFQVKTAGKMAFESQIEKGRHSLTINSGGNPSDMIHYEGSGSSTHLSIHVATDLHMQAGNNITLEAKSINLVATKAISILSEEDSISTQGQINVTHKAVTGAIGIDAKTDVGVSADTGQMKLTAKEALVAEGGKNVTVHADHIGLND